MNKLLVKINFLLSKVFNEGGYNSTDSKLNGKKENGADDCEFSESTTKNSLVKEYIKSYEANLKKYLKEKISRENKD